MTGPDPASIQTPSVLEYASPSVGRSRLQLPAWLDTLGWAAYLGCSWTWCIGMFLPVLLIRDYGLGGWWAFAVPNIVGAAAMGWILRSPRHGLAMTEAHRLAIRVFSYVTIAFHAFFFSLFASKVEWSGMEFIALVVVLFVIVGKYAERVLPTLVWCLSAALATWALARHQIPNVIAHDVHHPIHLDAFFALSAVMVFGFLLCPYLDQTFHRARQQTDTQHARWAFGLGFGGFFASMIVFTLSYSGWILPGFGHWAGGIMALVLFLHFSMQSLVTMSLHWPDTTRPGKPRFSAETILIGCIALAMGFCIWSQWLKRVEPETIYRLFLAPYGLLFPAYVLICMKPWLSDPSPPNIRQWALFAGAVVGAAPMYWGAFINDKMIWLLPAMGWVGLMWLFSFHMSARAVPA